MTSTSWPVASAPDGARADIGGASRAVVVTGASSHAGLAVAIALARRGDLVLMGSRHIEDCERVAAGLRAGGDAAFAAPLDLADTNSIERFVESARYLIGDVDVLIADGEIAEPDIVGVQHLATHLIPAMLKSGRGDVVLIGPPAALHGWLSALEAEFVGTGLRACHLGPAAAGDADDQGRFIAAMLDIG